MELNMKNVNITDEFNENYYVVLKDVLDSETCNTAVQHLFSLVQKNKTTKDEQCPLSDAVYGDPYFDKLLSEFTSLLSDVSGLDLLPTYSYARIYRPGEELKIHRDRPACEISATLTLGFSGKPWEIFLNKEESTENVEGILLDPGDAVIYKGTEIYHWRNKFEGEWMCQIFFHYVDADGPYRDEKFDSRPDLGQSASSKINRTHKDSSPIYYWSFEKILSNDYCNSVIGMYGSKQLKDGVIGSSLEGSINKNIRNVKNLQIPFYEGIGAHLIGSAFIANQQMWQFDINNVHQAEYLKYDVSGRYRAHIDSFFEKEVINCRKLTALAFLNDDFEGGKFFIQISDEKIYPVQTRGTIIVFPSFLLHGVEDVTSGIRHAVVCWINGPKFK